MRMSKVLYWGVMLSSNDIFLSYYFPCITLIGVLWGNPLIYKPL